PTRRSSDLIAFSQPLLYHRLRNVFKLIGFQQNIQQGPAENTVVIARTAAGDGRVTHAAAQRTPRPIRRKTQRDPSRRKYRATSVSRSRRQRAATQTPRA